MCTSSHWIYNKYIKKTILVDCGKCPTCLQKKAASRSARIRNSIKDGEVALFVTLTYQNKFVPYVFRKHIDCKYNELNIYRDYSGRYVRYGKGSDYSQSFVSKRDFRVIDSLWMHDCYPDDIGELKDLKHYKGRIGVCYYPDVQNFLKRLRQNLLRHFNYGSGFSYFVCSEYGGNTQRPHFHLLLFIPSSMVETFKFAIDQSWPFNDKVRCPLYIDVARDAASYVSSYVNCGSDLSPLLSKNAFRQKHSYSKTFGMGLECFSLSQIREKINSGDLRYYSVGVDGGKSSLVSFPIPKYVINRYFPYFKGFSRLDACKVYDYIQRPERLFELSAELDYSPDDLYEIFVRLNNSFDRYRNICGASRIDYALDYVRCWSIHSSVCLRDSLSEVDDVFDWFTFYENIPDYKTSLVRSLSLDELCIKLSLDKDNFQSDPNLTKHRLKLRAQLEPLYYKLCKQKNVTNIALSESGFEL